MSGLKNVLRALLDVCCVCGRDSESGEGPVFVTACVVVLGGDRVSTGTAEGAVMGGAGTDGGAPGTGAVEVVGKRGPHVKLLAEA